MDFTDAQLLSSELVQVKLENLNDSIRETRGTPETSVPREGIDEASTFSAGNIQNTCVSKLAAQTSAEANQFKTPSPVRPPQCSTFSKHSTQGKPKQVSEASSSLSVQTEHNSDIHRPSSSKKRPAVKIASFAKASSVDRLAPNSTARANVSKHSVDSLHTAISSSCSSQVATGGSKQPTSQTSLPTPALNAALRSFFNYNAQSEASPSSDASHSEDDEEDDDADVEEEEILVYMQFDSKLDSDLLQPHTPFKIIGIDSEKPVLQLGNQVCLTHFNNTFYL